jgi:hypothetical protein
VDVGEEDIKIDMGPGVSVDERMEDDKNAMSMTDEL